MVYNLGMNKKKRFILRKYVMARDIPEALRLDRKTTAEECYLDPEWVKLQDDAYKKIGFSDRDNNLSKRK